MAFGLLFLVAGAEMMVRGAVALAARLKIRPLIVGLSIVAFGSSAPQLAVSLRAVTEGAPDIAVGSVIGGNIFSVLVTLGCCALITPLRVSRQVVRMDLPLMIAANVLVFALVLNENLGRFEGAVLLVGLAVYLLILLRQSQRHGRTFSNRGSPPHPLRSGALFLVGSAVMIQGSHWLLEGTVEVATDLGLSERIIGLTVVGVGAALPEFATCMLAVMRGQRDLAVGNVIGSNLFNLLGVLGLSAVVAPEALSISPNALSFDLPVMLGVTVLVLPLFYAGHQITRLEGLVMLGLYAAYGLHVITFTFGMPQANRLEHLMLFYVLPILAVILFWRGTATWRKRH